jgi:myo-inositol-1(or 4)-monophosphatase
MIAGIIYAPYIKELFVAEKGKGAYFNGKKMKPSKIDNVDKSLAVTGFPYGIRDGNERVFKSFKDFTLRSQAVRRIGSAALDIAYAACGRFDFFWEEGISAWDIAAGIIIAKEAGCSVSDYQGSNDYFDNQSIVVAGNKALHKEVLSIINE